MCLRDGRHGVVSGLQRPSPRHALPNGWNGAERAPSHGARKARAGHPPIPAPSPRARRGVPLRSRAVRTAKPARLRVEHGATAGLGWRIGLLRRRWLAHCTAPRFHFPTRRRAVTLRSALSHRRISGTPATPLTVPCTRKHCEVPRAKFAKFARPTLPRPAACPSARRSAHPPR